MDNIRYITVAQSLRLDDSVIELSHSDFHTWDAGNPGGASTFPDWK